MQAIVKAVFGGEKLRGQGGHFAGQFTAGLGQAADFAAGAKAFGPFPRSSTQAMFGLWPRHPGDRSRPGSWARTAHSETFQRQAGDAEAGTVAAGQLFEVQVHRDLNRESERSV